MSTEKYTGELDAAVAAAAHLSPAALAEAARNTQEMNDDAVADLDTP